MLSSVDPFGDAWMHTVELLQEAVEAARRLGYEVRQDWLGGNGGGHCLVRGRKWLLLDLFDSASIYLNHTDEHNEFVSGIGYEDEQMTNEASTGLLKHSPILAQMAKDLQPVICPDVRQLADWIWFPVQNTYALLLVCLLLIMIVLCLVR
jgi:hypothetical protein